MRYFSKKKNEEGSQLNATVILLYQKMAFEKLQL